MVWSHHWGKSTSLLVLSPKLKNKNKSRKPSNGDPNAGDPCNNKDFSYFLLWLWGIESEGKFANDKNKKLTGVIRLYP